MASFTYFSLKLKVSIDASERKSKLGYTPHCPSIISDIFYSSKYQMKGLSGGGDMEFKQIMGRIAPDNGPKKVGYSGQHSIIG